MIHFHQAVGGLVFFCICDCFSAPKQTCLCWAGVECQIKWHSTVLVFVLEWNYSLTSVCSDSWDISSPTQGHFHGFSWQLNTHTKTSSDWNISDITGWIFLKCTDIHAPQRINPTDYCGLFSSSSLVAPSAQAVIFFSIVYIVYLKQIDKPMVRCTECLRPRGDIFGLHVDDPCKLSLPSILFLFKS